MSFKHILFPLDFSECNCTLKRQVEWLAARFNSRVTLLHVFEIPATWHAATNGSHLSVDSFNDLRNSMRKRLDEYAIRVPELRLGRVLAEADAAAQIIHFAHDYGVDVIVMGTHGCGALQGWLLGSVTAKVLDAARCPIWTGSLRHVQPLDVSISKILCAIDAIDVAVPILRFTGQLAQDLGAAVRLVHSVPELETPPSHYVDFDLHRYLMESARVDLAKRQREAGTDFPVTISGFGISRAINETAIEYGADLIATGRGNAGKPWGRFHTHIYDIVRHAPCPVLSYSASQSDRTSSSCNAEHLSQSAEDERLLTGSRTS